MKQIISTDKAPRAIGAYSQAAKVGDLVFLSGQIALNPQTNTVDNQTIEIEITRVFENLKAICIAAGGDLDHIIKLTIYLTDLKNHYAVINQLMEQHFTKPYPARAVVEVSALPKEVSVEIDAVMRVGIK